MSEKKYDASATHIENDIKFNLFSSVDILSQINEGYRVSSWCQNELVDKNDIFLIGQWIVLSFVECKNYPTEDTMNVKHLSIAEYSRT
jgi:hypothetical protein